jgi:hypothetical protein
VRFLKLIQVLIINNNSKYENVIDIKSTTSKKNSYNKDVYIAIKIMSIIANITYFVNKKAFFNINKISYIAF